MGDHADFAAHDRQAADTFRTAADDAPVVEQIVYLGGLGDEQDASLSPHLSSRHEVGRVLAAGRVPVTELRAAVIIGSGSASFEMLRNLTEVLPVMVTPKWVTTRCQPMAIRDILHWLVTRDQHARRQGPGARGRRARRRHLRGDDARLRADRRAPQAPGHPRAPAHPAPVVALDRPRHAAPRRAWPDP